MKKTLLAILAHPDDESFGPGGTMAKYALEGEVHIAIATDGAAGSVAEGHEDARDHLVEVRHAELDKACDILGATLYRLNYRDSGMQGDEANTHPDAWINSDDTEAIGRVVKLIRDIKPQVVVTHDETGGYFHPDHIRCCDVVTPAFFAAADPNQYPELGDAYQADRLFYTAFPKKYVNFFTRIMRLRGQDPSKMGRNEDIDFTKLGIMPEKIHAEIDIKPYWDIKMEASAAHASQGGGGGRRMFGIVPMWVAKRWMATDTFIRKYPETADNFRESDLFNF